MLISFSGRSYYRLTYPKLTVAVVAGSFDDANLLAVSWHTYLSFDPPLYGVSIAPERYTYSLIERYGDFSVNFLPAELSEVIWRIGNVSGREVDKFREFGLRKMRGKFINAPIIPDSLSALECRVVNKFKTGDHVFIVGEILHAWYNKSAFPGGILDNTRNSHVYYSGKGRFVRLARDPPSKFD